MAESDLHAPELRIAPEREDFYAESLDLLVQSGHPFLLSGTFALSCYTGINRPTKDVDVFAKPSDALKVLAWFREHGRAVEMVDERWLARITRGDLFMDLIFSMPTSGTSVSDDWFRSAPKAQIYDSVVHLVPPTEFIVSKIFVQDRYRYDGADVAHVILKKHEEIDWRRLLDHLELYWEVLLMALLNFRFVYPSERDLIPKWLMDELLERLAQRGMPGPGVKVCRGRIFSPRDYQIDVAEWGFSEAFGNLEERYEHH
ncbi:hypothetical protein SCH01S_35_00020 [Sphingomonas changbaiensis NBRC 104936]|uniref:Nucleotidyltransferase n=1 Tax=Sphingomonas changbaiensis NBRC 104936 TaxID=1219043 RepID=A0A0E9MP77_9SPHN|nr:nucleotidyltransferase [Sphingomonas changbaiensis]GAO39567.1 hypothetical protein SCH01S_35_00020 [Sphingomonas changbaiensis NBRC 104936]